MAFYRTGHKVISATNIIMNDADKIDTVLPEQLKMGDFVVVRETAKDLIREMADVILARSGKAGLREMAGKWKEALEIETLFYSDDEIYQHLQKQLYQGITKRFVVGFMTMMLLPHKVDRIWSTLLQPRAAVF